MSELSRRLSAARDAKGLSNRQLAARLTLDESTVSLWMRGKRTPQVKNLERLAVELGVEMSALWDGGQAVPATPMQKAIIDEMGDLEDSEQELLLAMARTLRAKKA